MYEGGMGMLHRPWLTAIVLVPTTGVQRMTELALDAVGGERSLCWLYIRKAPEIGARWVSVVGEFTETMRHSVLQGRRMRLVQSMAFTL